MRQANDDMKRAASQNASAADARRAAERLREATGLLGGAQQQDAAGRLNSMAQTAEQLAAQQKQQADRVRELMAQLNAARAAGQPPKYPSAQEIDKMVDDRQQVADDLSRLTQEMRTAARELAPTQPAASGKLRSALDGLDENNLDTRMQRSSDRLREGKFSDPEETGFTNDLQKLGQQVTDAARAVGRGQPTSQEAAINRAMDDLSRLRDQIAGLGGTPNSQPGQRQQGQLGQPGQQPGQERASPGSRAKGKDKVKVRVRASKAASPVKVVKPADANPGMSATAPVQSAIRITAEIGVAWRSATLIPATLAPPARTRPRPCRVKTRPTPSARLSKG